MSATRPEGSRSRTASPCPTSRNVTSGRSGGPRGTSVVAPITRASTTTATGRVRLARTRITMTADVPTPTGPSCGHCSAMSAIASTAPASAEETATAGLHPTTTASDPVIVAPVTSGAEKRFAIGDIRGTAPKWRRRIGTTEICAAVAAPSVAHRGRGRRPENIPDPMRMPTVAATESWNPTSAASCPLKSSRAPTATPMATHVSTTMPDAAAPRTVAAMKAARSTDASHRVTTTKIARPSTPTAKRRLGPMPTNAVITHQAAKKSATLEPDTATK